MPTHAILDTNGKVLWSGEARSQKHAVMQAVAEKVPLPRADLHGADLDMARLSGARLPGADLSNAVLDEANLCVANLAGTNLRDASLRGALLNQATLQGACLNGADLNKAELREACLCGACLELALLNGAILTGSCVAGAILPSIVPSVPDLKERILARHGKSQLTLWWAVVAAAGEEGLVVCQEYGAYTAAELIYAASYPDLPIPSFYNAEFLRQVQQAASTTASGGLPGG